jgi:hypothetical protein
MKEQEMRALFFERLEHLDAEADYELRHPDYVMEMPQSGERIRGRDAMRAFRALEEEAMLDVAIRQNGLAPFFYRYAKPGEL